MLAATAKKSAAYEKGVREGRADKTKNPKSEIIPEGEEEKESEGPDKEEGMDGAAAHSRKRSARGAKNTKSPMDAEGCACGGKGRKGKASCDGDCGMKKRSDALTAPEYLAACDLGIQDMPRPYIRARLDTDQRLDLKCGKGAISKGEKCTKGAATTAEKITVGAGLIGAVASTVGMARAKNTMAFERAATGFHGSAALATAGITAMQERRGNKNAARAGQILTAGQIALAGASGFKAERMRKERNQKIRNTIPMIREAKTKANDRFVSALKGAKYATNPDNIPEALKTPAGVEAIYRGAERNVTEARQARSAARSALRGSISELKGIAPLSAARRRRRQRNGESIWATGFGI